MLQFFGWLNWKTIISPPVSLQCLSSSVLQLVSTSKPALFWKGIYLSYIFQCKYTTFYCDLKHPYSQTIVYHINQNTVLCCRYFFVTCPMLNFIRQTKGSILVSVLIWTVCVITISVIILLHQHERIFVFTFYPAPLFILCLAGTLKALPAATSVPAEEKRRIIGTLFLLHLNYFVLVLPAVILLSFVRNVSLAMILLSPFVDLMLFCFMQKGPVDSLLSCLCCCSMNNTAADVSSRSPV